MKRLLSLNDLENLRHQLLSAYNPNRLRIRICMTGCRAHGAAEICQALRQEISRQGMAEAVEILETGCHGFCAGAPVMVIDPDDIFYQQVKVEDVSEIVSQTLKNSQVVNHLLYCNPTTGERVIHTSEIPFYQKQLKIVLKNCGKIDPTNINQAIIKEAYSAFSRVLFQCRPEQVIEEVKKSGLRGRGGAGFPTGLKWELAARAGSGEKFLVCNADEGDPGAFMDRAVLEGDPHRVLEGMLIGAYAIGAQRGFIYVRAEYPIAVRHLQIALQQAQEMGLLGDNILGTDFSFQLEIKEGAGAFVCGEETALIASLEGKRGMPRPRPPFPVQSGLWGKPTCINNVETFANIPTIINRGAQWYASLGTERSKGTKVFALAGKVNYTGLVEVPMGISLREIIYQVGGGIPRQRKFKAVQVGGPSGGCIPEQYLDLPVDYGALESVGAIMGSGGMIVMDEDICMVDIARFFMDFIQNESCGKCVPCRIGTQRMLEILTRITEGKGQPGDLELLEELARSVKDSALCGLGQTAPNPVLSTLRYFREEYESHLLKKHCPACTCKALFVSPCQHTCPLGTDVPTYVSLIAEGKFAAVRENIREKNPFPAICGRVCHHPCETRCRREKIDEPIAIRALKRFAMDYTSWRSPVVTRGKVLVNKNPEVGIVGAGPCGLTAAYFLSRWGYQVTVWETLPQPGGMLRVGIPDYRLPKDILDKEIASLGELKIRTGYRVGKDISWEELRKQYRAILIATGAHHNRKLGLSGEEMDGVLDGVSFLRDINLGRKIEIGPRVAVIGGGNVAIDAARCALRLGAGEVNILYRRTPQEMPAIPEEIDSALAEGIKISYLVNPRRILGNNRVTGIECIRMRLGEYDRDGRRKPVQVEGSEFTLSMDTIIAAIGQVPDLSFLPQEWGIVSQGTIQVNPYTFATAMPGIFAGGDVVTGPATVIEAIAAGREAAISIDLYLRGKNLMADRPPAFFKMTKLGKRPEEELLPQSRVIIPVCDPESRIDNFEEVEHGLTRAQAVKEARRCLRCDLEED